MDRTLYSLVFGESVLNDAVAIVLYHTLLRFEATQVTVGSFFTGVFFFLENFVGSLSIGVAIGLLSALLFKYVRIQVRSPFTSIIVPLHLLLLRRFCAGYASNFQDFASWACIADVCVSKEAFASVVYSPIPLSFISHDALLCVFMMTL